MRLQQHQQFRKQQPQGVEAAHGGKQLRKDGNQRRVQDARSPGPIGKKRSEPPAQPSIHRSEKKMKYPHEGDSRAAANKVGPLLLDVGKEVWDKMGMAVPSDSPEDVSAWIAARRANWPSRTTVDRKEKEAAARAERGELPPRAQRQSLKESVAKKRSIERGEAQQRREITSAYASKSNGDGFPGNGALASLAAHYAGDSSGNEDEGDKEAAWGGLQNQKDANGSLNSGRGKVKGKKKKGRARGRGKGRNGNQGPGNTLLPKRKPTLLRRLLDDEIRREQSIVLQCLRILVQENFFHEDCPADGLSACDRETKLVSAPQATETSLITPMLVGDLNVTPSAPLLGTNKIPAEVLLGTSKIPAEKHVAVTVRESGL